MTRPYEAVRSTERSAGLEFSGMVEVRWIEVNAEARRGITEVTGCLEPFS